MLGVRLSNKRKVWKSFKEKYINFNNDFADFSLGVKCFPKTSWSCFTRKQSSRKILEKLFELDSEDNSSHRGASSWPMSEPLPFKRRQHTEAIILKINDKNERKFI